MLEFNTLFLTRLRTLLDHPKQKPRRGGGFRQINTCRKEPLHGKFFDNDIAFYQSYLSTGENQFLSKEIWVYMTDLY